MAISRSMARFRQFVRRQLVVIQVAGGQLSPRMIATTLLRNNVARYSVGLFVFTLVFAVGALNRRNTATPRSTPNSALDWGIQTHFSRPEELALVRTPESQGLGGSMRTGTAIAELKTPAEPLHR